MQEIDHIVETAKSNNSDLASLHFTGANAVASFVSEESILVSKDSSRIGRGAEERFDRRAKDGHTVSGSYWEPCNGCHGCDCFAAIHRSTTSGT